MAVQPAKNILTMQFAEGLAADVENVGGDAGDAEDEKDAGEEEGHRGEWEALPVGCVWRAFWWTLLYAGAGESD